MTERERYEQLFEHLEYHHAKKWLLDGCDHEDARTIRDAVEQLDQATLNRRLARALAKGSHT